MPVIIPKRQAEINSRNRILLVFLIFLSTVVLIAVALFLYPKPEKKNIVQPSEEQQPVEDNFKPGESFFGTALYIAGQVEDYYEKNACLNIITINLCDAKKYDKASETAGKIEDSYTRAQSLGIILQYMIDGKMIEEGLRLADQIHEIANNLSDPMEKATALVSCRYAYRQAGDKEKADEIQSEINNIMQSVKKEFPGDISQSNPISDVMSNIETEIDEVSALAHEFDFTGALESAKTIENKASRACALSSIGAMKGYVRDPITDEEKKLLSEFLINGVTEKSTK